MSIPLQNEPPSPQLFFQTINAFQNTEVLKSAIELEVFGVIDKGSRTLSDLSAACNTSERGMRILVDYLVMLGFLVKEREEYTLTPSSKIFLVKDSPHYVGGMMPFLLSPAMLSGFQKFTQAVQQGGTAASSKGTTEAEHPAWQEFAKSMVPMMAGPADWIAERVTAGKKGPCRILDIAAGHGLFGVQIAQRNPDATVTANDWENVLPIAVETAQKNGVAQRYSTIPGNAFEVDLGHDYDVILLPNFLHHFSWKECEDLLKKLRGRLNTHGWIVLLEFVPNEDRISPQSAWFSIVMLATTPSGDAYTFSDYSKMLMNAGFSPPTQYSLPMSIETVLISTT